MRRLPARALLAASCLALPPVFALLFCACGVDGKTPNCADPNARCEPSAENPNPDATIDGADTSLRPDVSPDVSPDGTSDAPDASDAADVRTDGDARLDGDAKVG